MKVTEIHKFLTPFRRKIQTSEEYEEWLRTFSALMDKGESLTADEADYMDLLGTLLEEFEHRQHPELATDTLDNVSPVDAIRWAMDRHGLLQKNLSPYNWNIEIDNRYPYSEISILSNLSSCEDRGGNK